MDSASKQSGRRGAVSVAAAAVLLLVAGVIVTVIGVRGPEAPPAAAPEVASASPTQAGDSTPANTPKEADSPKEQASANGRGRPAAQADFGLTLPGSSPVGLSIPRIGVRADKIVGLGLASDGSIEVPRDASAPGWFTPGPSPGQLGPAVIAGHVDSESGPAVFYRLGELRPGDRVEVSRADGSVATFAVDKVEHYEKDAFPTRSVYGSTDRAELRLITCSGKYDSDTGYLSNTVAYAHLV